MTPRAGDAVVAHGRLDFYPPQGSTPAGGRPALPGRHRRGAAAVRGAAAEAGAGGAVRRGAQAPAAGLPEADRAGHLGDRRGLPRRRDRPVAPLPDLPGRVLPRQRPGRPRPGRARAGAPAAGRLARRRRQHAGRGDRRARAAARRRSWPASTTSGWRERSSPRPGRSSRRWATRPTSRSATSWPIIAPRRPRPPPRWSRRTWQALRLDLAELVERGRVSIEQAAGRRGARSAALARPADGALAADPDRAAIGRRRSIRRRAAGWRWKATSARSGSSLQDAGSNSPRSARAPPWSAGTAS